MAEYEAAERTNNQELQWVSHNEVQADSLEPDKNQVEVIPDDSMVPSRLISGTIVQTVKVWMQRMMKIGRSVGFAMRNAKYLDVLLAMKNAQRSPMNHSNGKECSACLKVAA